MYYDGISDILTKETVLNELNHKSTNVRPK